MKKFVIQLLVFFLVFSVIVLVVTRFDNTGRCRNKNANIQKLTCMSSFDSLDILFVGNSYCYSGINTACFDSARIKSFNLGTSSAGVYFFDVLVNDYLRSVSHKPKSVFILVSPMILASISDDAMTNPIYRFLNYPLSNEEYILSYDPALIKSYPKICARSFSRTFVGAYTYFTGRTNYCEKENNDMYFSKGYIPTNAVNSLKNELKTNHFYMPLLKNDFNKPKANKLLSIASELKKQNIEPVFYELPSNKLYTFFNSGYLSDYRAFLKQLQSQYIYLHVDMKLDESNYRDQDHLNSKGALVACKDMVKQIKDNSKLSLLYFNK